jgi:ABC-type lipoprotein export system ATPase subunit
MMLSKESSERGAILEVQKLTHKYPNEEIISFPDFIIPKGEPTLLLGNSGSGKTTLLHLLGGLMKPRLGKINVNGTDITQLSASQLDHFRGGHFGFVFQSNHLISALNVMDNLLMAPFLAGHTQSERRVEKVLSRLGLLEKRNARIYELSQGQVQRVAIARAVMNKPLVILADEPTSSLDDKNCDVVIKLLLEVSKENNTTLVVATHDQRLKSVIPNSFQL